MKRLHIQVISLNDHLGDIDDPADFLPELIAAGMGQTHVLTSRKKSMDKVDYLAAQGKFLGGLAPFGYRIEMCIRDRICSTLFRFITTLLPWASTPVMSRIALAALPSTVPTV